MKPGTLLWLLGFQLRVSWRAFRSRWVLLVLAALLLAELGFSLAYRPELAALVAPLRASPTLPDGALLPLLFAGGLLLSLMLSGAVNALLEGLFERGDLDLLLGSPLSPRVVLASRLLGALVGMLPLFLGLATLLLIPLLVGGLWRSLGLLLWLVCLLLLSVCAAALLTLGLVRLLGVRRARTLASVLGALLGAGFFLASQLGGQASSGQSWLVRLYERLQAVVPAPGALFWWPLRAIWLEPLPLLTLLSAAALLGLSVIRLLTRTFMGGTQESLAAAPRRAARLAGGPLRFAPADRAVLLKEWRLLFRDPLLLSRTLLQLVYLLPLMFVLLRDRGAAFLPLVVGAAGILALGSLSNSLATITANAEEAPDLLLASPTRLGRLRGLKLLAGVLPVLALWLLLTGVALSLSLSGAVLFSLALGLLAVLAAALIVLWRPLEVQRSDLFKRGQKQDLLGSFAFLAVQAGLLGAAYFVPVGSWVGWLGLGVAALIPLMIWGLGQRGRGQLA